MTFLELIETLRDRHLWVEVSAAGRAAVKGNLSAIDEGLRRGLAAHRADVLRLYRVRDRSRPAWRDRLDRADDRARAAWVLLANGYEADGLSPGAAEYLAWSDVESQR